jgi:hypothetical protein
VDEKALRAARSHTGNKIAKNPAQLTSKKEWKTLLAQAQNPLFAHPPGMAQTHTHAKKNYHRFQNEINTRRAQVENIPAGFLRTEARSKEKEKTPGTESEREK